jgi:arylsulfatase A-like enzyme
VDGLSLVPVLNGRHTEERPLFWHYPHYGNQGGQPSSIIRQNEWKLIHYHEDGHLELYNLKTDPEETNDVAAKYPDTTDQLKEQLDNFLKKTGARFPEKDPEYSAELEEEHLERIRTDLMPRLESQRLELLSKSYSPGNDWWGSSTEQ